MFLLLLMGLGAASVKAQVRIGGDGAPNPAAVLDLNATDATTGTKGLALPRVSLTDVSTPLTGTPVVNGMLVYNTNSSTIGGSGVGIYYWDGNFWNKLMPSSTMGSPVSLALVLDTTFDTPAMATFYNYRIVCNSCQDFDICTFTLPSMSASGGYFNVVGGPSAPVTVRAKCFRPQQ